MPHTKLRLFYDGQCPLCALEMKHLERANTLQHIQLIDIHEPGLQEQYPHINLKHANDILHAETSNGQLLLGLDATHAAWQLVGKGHRTGWLRNPRIAPFADKAYLFFAKHRHIISRLFISKKCNSQCSNNPIKEFNNDTIKTK